MDLWDAPIWPSARRHAVPDDAIRHALRHHFAYAADPEDESVDLFLGPDQAGNLVEIGILEIGEDKVIIQPWRRGCRGSSQKGGKRYGKDT